MSCTETTCLYCCSIAYSNFPSRERECVRGRGEGERGGEREGVCEGERGGEREGGGGERRRVRGMLGVRIMLKMSWL